MANTVNLVRNFPFLFYCFFFILYETLYFKGCCVNPPDLYRRSSLSYFGLSGIVKRHFHSIPYCYLLQFQNQIRDRVIQTLVSTEALVLNQTPEQITRNTHVIVTALDTREPTVKSVRNWIFCFSLFKGQIKDCLPLSLGTRSFVCNSFHRTQKFTFLLMLFSISLLKIYLFMPFEIKKSSNRYLSYLYLQLLRPVMLHHAKTLVYVSPMTFRLETMVSSADVMRLS